MNNDTVKRKDVLKALYGILVDSGWYERAWDVIDRVPAASTDGDCVSRSWLLAEYDRLHEGLAGKARKLIEDAPAVPREMTARELFSARDRMCNSNYNRGHIRPACKTCPLWRENNGYDMYCGTLMTMRPLAFVAIVEAWAQEHPERSEE